MLKKADITVPAVRTAVRTDETSITGRKLVGHGKLEVTKAINQVIEI